MHERPEKSAAELPHDSQEMSVVLVGAGQDVLETGCGPGQVTERHVEPRARMSAGALALIDAHHSDWDVALGGIDDMLCDPEGQ